MMIARRLFLSAALLSIASPAPVLAHTLRVIPARPVVEPGRPGTVYLSWGHLLPVDELVDAESIDAFELRTPSGSGRSLECSGKSLQANAVTFDEPGIYQASAIRSPAAFVRYNDASGRPVFALGPKSGLTLPEGASIVEAARSHQFAKAIVLCGAAEAATPDALGHPLELLLETPIAGPGLDPDAPVRVRVLFRGRPVAGARVLAASTTLNPDGLPEESAEADDEGLAELSLFEPGTWVIEVRHTIEADPSDRASHDVESFTASLTVPVGLPE